MELKHSRIEVSGLITCLLLSMILRLAVIMLRQEQLTEDRDVYLGIATGVVEGRGFCSPGSTTPTAFRPPLYPLILAGGMSFFRPAAVVAVVNILSGLVTVYLTASLGQTLELGWRRHVAALHTAVDTLALYDDPRPKGAHSMELRVSRNCVWPAGRLSSDILVDCPLLRAVLTHSMSSARDAPEPDH